MTRHRDERWNREGSESGGGRSGSARSGSGRRYASRYGDSNADTTARASANEQHGRDTGGRMLDRAHGGRRVSSHDRDRGNPPVGSQRGEDSV